MYLPKLVYLVGQSVAVAGAEIESGCGSVSTVFVTAPPATKTVSILYEAPSKAIKNHVTPAVLGIQSDKSTDITETSPDHLTFIQIVSSLPAISKAPLTDEGPYYYTVNKGTRVWLDGKSPPAGIPLVTETTVVTYKPVPLSEYVTNERTVDTASYLAVISTERKPMPQGHPADVLTQVLTQVSTVTTDAATGGNSEPTGSSNAVLTVVNTKYETKVLTKIVPVLSAATASSTLTPSSAILTGAGWNTTVKTLIEQKVVYQGTQPAKLIRRPTAAEANPTAQPGTLFSLSAPANSAGKPKMLEARQLGSVVSATINGAVVSWTNSYDGVPSITPTQLKASSNVASQEVSVPAETDKEAYPIYPWNLQPIPVQVFSTSSSGSSKFSAFQTPLTQPGLPNQESSIQNELRETTVLNTSSFKQPAPTTIVTSVLDVLPANRVESTTAKQSVPTTIVTSIVPVLSAPQAASNTASTLQFANTSATSRSAVSATPSLCRRKANFIVDFDDLPYFSTGPDDVDIPQIFNPYRKLFFENHYGYVPPPSDPFPPVSPPQLAVYRANQRINVDGSPDAGLESVGEFGAGPRASDSAYWIDAFSVWLGCENAGPSDCIVTINGYVNGSSTRAVSQTVTQAPCPGLVDCKLALVEFTDDFRNLSGIQILAAVERKLTVYYIDDLSLGWSNNTCEAQKQRLSSP